MVQRVTTILSRKVIVSVLLVVFAVVATAGGIAYYRHKTAGAAVQSNKAGMIKADRSGTRPGRLITAGVNNTSVETNNVVICKLL